VSFKVEVLFSMIFIFQEEQGMLKTIQG